MGSLIYLRVGQLEVDWGKNNGFVDHNALFQPSDLRDIPYYYIDRRAEIDPTKPGQIVEDTHGDRWCLVTEFQEGFSKRLSEVCDRIEMLGYTDSYCRHEFSYFASLKQFDETLFTYDELAAALREVDVTNVSLRYCEGSEEFGKFFRREIFPRLPLARVAAHPEHARDEAAEAMENLSAYTVLRLLADNPTARELNVIWAFKDVVDGGYAERADFVHSLDKQARFSIITEGTSDAEILKKALGLRMPHIADFFSFVEVGYPFPGTGGAVNFVKGLVSIGVHNNVLVLFDNDAEGCSAWQKCVAIGLPDNVIPLKLPDLPDFENVPVDGPTGSTLANINGRAAAIECYLDLGISPEFYWKNFNDQIKAYQGELKAKDSYKRAFLAQRELDIRYDYRKLDAVLAVLRQTAIARNEASLIANLRRKRDNEDDR